MTQDHPSDEELSAYLDEEDPAPGPHVTTCGRCSSRVEELRAVAALVAAPVPPPPDARRDEAIATALRRSGRSGRLVRTLAAAGAAAAVLLAVLAITLTSGSRRGTDVASKAADREEDQAGSTAPEVAGSADAGDAALGEIGDPATLRARLEPILRARQGDGVDSPSAGEALAMNGPEARRDTAADGTTDPTGTRAAGGAPAPATPGTPACESPARAAGAASGPLLYWSRAGWRGRPAFVLAFATPAGPSGRPGVAVYVMARDGCRLLFSDAYG